MKPRASRPRLPAPATADAPTVPARRQRGMALLLTLTIITVLVTAGLELNRRVRNVVTGAAHLRDTVLLEQMAAGGVHAAMALLVRDRKDSEIDSIQEEWADAEILTRLLEEIPFETGRMAVKITDELSRIQVNALVRFPEGQDFNLVQHDLWDRFLHLLITPDLSGEETDAATVLASLKDWLDKGDDDAITGLNGAEEDYYRSLDPPYPCPNGPIRDAAELRRIRGVTPELYASAGGSTGLADFISVHGAAADGQAFTYEGKININTADLPVLAALLPAEHVDLAESIFDYRQERGDDGFVNELTGSRWYRNAPGAADVEIDEDLITTRSDLFRIVAVAAVNDLEVGTEAVVKREKHDKSGKWRCSLLSWTTQ